MQPPDFWCRIRERGKSPLLMHSIPYLQREPYRRRYTHQHPQQAHDDPSLVQSRHGCCGIIARDSLSLAILEATACNMRNMP